MRKLLLILLFSFLIITPVWGAYISNADIDDEDMADISDWADGDNGTGESSQVTFEGASCMKLDTGASAGAGSFAKRTQDLGSFGTRVVVSVSIDADAIGTLANGDCLYMNIDGGNTQCVCIVGFASDGLFIHDGVSQNEVGTDLVVVGTKQEWTFDIDETAQTVDVYLGGALQASDVDCSITGTTNGNVFFNQRGTTTANRITYIDWEKAGSDFEAGARRVIIVD